MVHIKKLFNKKEREKQKDAGKPGSEMREYPQVVQSKQVSIKHLLGLWHYTGEMTGTRPSDQGVPGDPGLQQSGGHLTRQQWGDRCGIQATI